MKGKVEVESCIIDNVCTVYTAVIIKHAPYPATKPSLQRQIQ